MLPDSVFWTRQKAANHGAQVAPGTALEARPTAEKTSPASAVGSPELARVRARGRYRRDVAARW
jgi:hypothetical protein